LAIFNFFFNTFRVPTGSLAPSSALPIGIDRKVSETQLVKVEPDDNTLLHSILAISSANNPEEHSLLESSIIGFVYV